MSKWKPHNREDNHGQRRLVCTVDSDGRATYFVGYYNGAKGRWEDEAGRELPFIRPAFISDFCELDDDLWVEAIEDARERLESEINSMHTR